MTTHKDRVLDHREHLIVVARQIMAFRNRRNLALSYFEILCKRKKPEARNYIASSLRVWGQEMAEHGFYSHYQGRLIHNLMEAGFSEKKATDFIFAYHFSGESEKADVVRHIKKGLVRHRKGIIPADWEEKKYKKYSLTELGKKVLNGSRFFMLAPTSMFNLVNQFKKKTPEEKTEILNHFQEARNITRKEGIDQGIKNLTDSLLPHFFRESKPFKNKSMALYAAYLSRPEKFSYVKVLVEAFAWMFLSQNYFGQESYLRQLKPQKRLVTKAKTVLPLNHQNQR